MDVSSHALGRESFAIDTATNGSAIEVVKGDAAGHGAFQLTVDGTEHDFAITQDMTKEDFANKLNNIDGISGVEVNEATVITDAAVTTATASTVDVSFAGADLVAGDNLKLTVDNVELNLTGAQLALADDSTASPATTEKTDLIASLNQQLSDAGSDVVISASSFADGNTSMDSGFTFTRASGEAIEIASELTSSTATAVVNVGTTALDVDGGTLTGTETSTDGVAVQDAVTETHFTVDFSNAKIDTDIKEISFKSKEHDEDSTVAGTPGAAGAVIEESLSIGNVKTIESVAGLDLSTADGAQNAIDVLDAAMEQIDEKRAEIGAFQNRMNHTMSNLANINENVNASNSRIKDVDFASETINMTKGQILQQAGTSILAQAKQIPQAALSLLG
ncbi:flagellin [Photobacterium leiognathi]|uniref:flagellin n=1 Tax=Photobacterium leiognathi TaxID=553611 RepID=UPI0039BFB1E7